MDVRLHRCALCRLAFGPEVATLGWAALWLRSASGPNRFGSLSIRWGSPLLRHACTMLLHSVCTDNDSYARRVKRHWIASDDTPTDTALPQRRSHSSAQPQPPPLCALVSQRRRNHVRAAAADTTAVNAAVG